MAYSFNFIQNIIEESERLLLLSDALKWDEFSTLNEERQIKISELDFSHVSLTDSENSQLYHYMLKLIDLNKKLEAKCSEYREQIVGEISNLRKSNKVAQAYSQ